MLSPINEIIADLSNRDEPLPNSRLTELANMDSAELTYFKQVWPTMGLRRRRQIVSRLVELAENNFELDFDNVFKNCLDDEDAEVRSKAIEGLWENEEPSLINTLLNLFEHDSKIYQALLATINDNSQPLEVKRRALEAIAPMDSPEVGKTISEAYHSGHPKLRVSSIYAMGKNCNPAWLPLLLKELASADAEIRYEAAAACGEIGEEEAAPHLIELIDDRDIEVQLAAIRALGKIGGTEAKNCLEQCLDDDNETIQQAAEQALYELNEGEEPLSFSL